MGQMIWNTLKVFIIFIACTILFYTGLRMMHAEYEQYRRYDPPKGRSIKVFKTEDQQFMDRLNLFFRLGE